MMGTRAARRRQSRGFLLITGMLVLSFCLTLTSVGLTRSLTEMSASNEALRLSKAFHAAEAGLDHAINDLAADGDLDLPVNPASPETFEPGTTYKVTLHEALGGATHRIVIRGESGGVAQAIEIVVDVGGANVPDGAIISDGPVNVVSSSATGAAMKIKIEGNIIANLSGNQTILMREGRVLRATDPTTNTLIPDSGSLILAGVTGGVTPTLYVDRGKNNVNPRRAASTVSGNATVYLGDVDGSGQPLIDPAFQMNTPLPDDFTYAEAEADAQLRHIGLLSYDGAGVSAQPTTIAGRIKTQQAPVALSPVTIPPTPPIGAFANDCTHHFVFRPDNNTLTQPGAPLQNWAGPGAANRKLPAGVYCFASMKSEAPDWQVAHLLFDGPATIYIKSNVAQDPEPVRLGACQGDFGDATTHDAQINYQVDLGDGQGPRTLSARNLWILVQGAGAVRQVASRISGSYYAPESAVTIDGYIGDDLLGKVIDKSLLLMNHTQVRNRMPPGEQPPGFGRRILAWRQVPL